MLRSEKGSIGIVLIAIVAIILVVGMSLAGSYNSLVNLEENVEVAKANVQTMMQRRLELIPDLVATVKQYTKHEEAVFKEIADARAALNSDIKNNASTEELQKSNEQLTQSVNKLLVIAEAYPQLTSGQQYTSLMDQLEGSVNRISVAREEYNTQVSKYNKAIRSFPKSMIAGMFGFEKVQPFQADEEANKTNMVDFGE